MVDLDRFRRCTEWHDHANRLRYVAPPDPWRLVPVDPTRVERFTVVDLRYGLGQVRGGDWDRPAECRSLTDTRIHEGLVQRFEEGRSWTDTVYHEYVRDRFDSEHGFRGMDDFDSQAPEWFEHVESLYESIAEGYRTNRGTTHDDPVDLEYVHQMDPIALVGRDGEVVWTEGFHRLTLARIAGVDRVPVYVLWRHEKWQERRDAVARAVADDGDADDSEPLSPAEALSDTPATVEHPDVADLV